MPPRIFIQMGISTWTEITVQQKNFPLQVLSHSPSQGRLPTGSSHCLLFSFTALAPPSQAEPELLTDHRREQEGHGLSFCAPRWVVASWLSRPRLLPWQPLRSQPPAVSDLT